MSFSKKAVAAHLKRNEFDDVERLCREAIAADQRNGEAWHFRGLAAIGMGAAERGVQYFLRAIFHKPGDCAMHINLGIALSTLERYDEAGRAFQLAAEFAPASFEAQQALASHYFNREEAELADVASKAAVALKPDSIAAWELQSRIARKRGDSERSLEAARRALALNEALPVSHRLAADALMRKQEFDAAYEHYVRSLELDSEDCEARGNFATLLTRMGHPEEALEHYYHSIKTNPGDDHTRHGLSLALLTLGRFDEGWPLYAHRTWAYTNPPPKVAPLLERLPQAGERVLYIADQGPGEEIMFASLLPELLRTGAHATVVCNGRLVSLFRRSFPSVRFIARGTSAAVEADWQIGLPDTAKWLRRSFSDFPAEARYLTADSASTSLMREEYRAGNHLPLIGISWSTIDKSKVSTQKTIPLHRWGPILSMPGVRFVSLQYGPCEDEIAAAEKAFGVRITRDPRIDALGDLDTFASQVAAMDLVITTSNTTAHVAGGLGVPAWTFVPVGHGGFWHWFLARDVSAWYPSVRLFRQKTRGDWQPAIDAVSERFAGFVENWETGK
ncbi:MAG: tetratricopeptide repeat protein [Rhodospirillaceae bacterium]